MKWLGGGESTEMLNQTNGHAPQMIRQSNSQVPIAPGNSEDLRQMPMSRSQEDGMVSYIFHNPQSEPEYLMQHPPQPFEKSLQQPQLAPMRWALGDDVLVDHHPQHQQAQQQHQHQHQHHNEGAGEPMMFPHGPHHLGPPPGIIQHQPHLQMQRNGQIAPSAKKLWGVEEVKEDGPKGILNLNDHQMWRNPTWSTSDHTVSQPMMVARRSGSFPGSEVASNILSPRSSETSGLGVKMVEYVLSTSPKREDHLDARMRGLVLNNEGGVEGVKKDDKNKGQKELVENGNCGTTVVQQNGGIVVVQNGTVLDDDKTFNDSSVAGHPYSGITSLNSHILQERISIRTPGSRQPSPSDEDLTKNGVGGMMVIDSGDTLLGQQVQMAPPPHHHLTAADFSHPFHTPPQGYSGGTQTSGPPQQPGPPQESPSVMQPSFDVQQLFRSQQQQAAVAGAANPATAQQLQLLQQQQYLQQQQQLTAGLPGATFAPPAPYIINPQEPYVITGPTVVPQYYGVHGVPWGVYPANIIQQSHSAAAAAAQQRRPLSPTSAATESANIQTQVQPSGYQMIPAYYDQNGSIMVTRGLSNGTPTVRLVSPAPVLVNHAAAATTPGLGLGSGSSGRRDSFDRNTSAFSPSLDYGRAKWPQNYGALGTVTASPSPLGLASGSLTPPPALGSSSNLQLGALMGNTSSRTTLLSAAPGAEGMSKFRSNGTLATNGEYLNGE